MSTVIISIGSIIVLAACLVYMAGYDITDIRKKLRERKDSGDDRDAG